MKNVLEMLETSAHQNPFKTAVADETQYLTYQELLKKSQAVGTELCSLKKRNVPIAVLMKKHANSLAAYFGVVYSGNFYIVIDADMPCDRINSIFSTLSPAAVLSEHSCNDKLNSLNITDIPIFYYEDLITNTINLQTLKQVREHMIDTDPLYALFTSGSTGMPKGAVVCHRNVLAYSSWTTTAFHFDSNTVFGNQTPFYFSMSVLDIFSSIRVGASLHIIPKSYFSFPMYLMNFMRERKINTIYWVPSALCLVANWKALDSCELPDLTKILFAGEVMPTKHLNYWRRHIPNAFYANLFGPTEVTDICTYYVVNRELSDDEPVPIGKACDNCGILVLNENNEEAKPGEEGELCVRGSFVAMGYYNNAEKTASAFTQNPLNPYYPELIYRTGDLVRQNSYGELMYLTRKDFQIKRMGYRIELGEIETAVNSLPEIKACACVYEHKTEKIRLFYQGNGKEEKIRIKVQEKVPKYMYPNEYIKLPQMPYNANGKIDRKYLASYSD